ncbi:hypothetical protein IWX49DRAFT_585916 [Phyllosticta citricarpa]
MVDGCLASFYIFPSLLARMVDTLAPLRSHLLRGLGSPSFDCSHHVEPGVARYPIRQEGLSTGHRGRGRVWAGPAIGDLAACVAARRAAAAARE